MCRSLCFAHTILHVRRFYSGIDREYLGHNPFVEALKSKGLGHIKAATRVEVLPIVVVVVVVVVAVNR